jgi:hypothetical protein
MPFHHYSTIDLVLVVPKSLLVNHLRNGLGTVVALSDQHVQSGYFFVFALDFLFKPCMVSLESIYINIRANRTTFVVEALESSVAL